MIPGFRAISLLAAALCALGLGQLLALTARDEPYPVCAAAFALLLLAGGAVLLVFVTRNLLRGVASDEATARASAADVLIFAALTAVFFEAVYLSASTGILFPLRMALFSRGAAGEDPLPMMLAGTCLIALGALATAALIGALWTLLYERSRTRLAQSAVSFAGAVPYVAFALVLRALVCKPVAFLAAGRSLALRPDDRLAYDSMLGIAPGLLAASLATGLACGRGLWAWLERVRSSEEGSESFLAATVRGEAPWEIVLRHGLWLRRRRELSALLLGGMAAAALSDVLSNALIDSFRGVGFPPYPSLGAVLFLRGVAGDGAPAPLPLSWATAYVLVIAAALALVVAQVLPEPRAAISLEKGELRVGGRLVASGLPSVHAVAARPAVQWVLGASGAGKSLLLKAWAAQLPDAIVVPQDPDEALSGALSLTDLAPRDERAAAVVGDVLGRFDDQKLQRRLRDPFTPVSACSRGERQRLSVALAIARAGKSPLLFDEPTSAQDPQRTQALIQCLDELRAAAGDGPLIVTSHDAELLGQRAADDEVAWIGPASGYDEAIDRLLEAKEDVRGIEAAGPSFRVAPAGLSIGGRRHTVSAEARVRAGELIVLSGASGCGKTTLLRAICREGSAQIGYVAQDTARAYPPQMPVAEVVGAEARHWFGAELPLRRSIASLSEGERQRVVLAAEVTRLERLPPGKLKLLLLDEPFGALDPPAHLRLMDALFGWLRAAPGRAAVLVSHSPLVDLGLAGANGVAATQWMMGEEAA